MFSIERHVSIPKTIAAGHAKYPFASMEINDSFLVADDNLAINVVRSAHSYGKRHEKKFTSRKTTTGTRIWRIA
jgi:hypothetical protein